MLDAERRSRYFPFFARVCRPSAVPPPVLGYPLISQETAMQWTQVYDPFGHWWLSTLVAALPIVVLFTLLAGLKVKPHWCAISGALTAVLVAIIFFKMPPVMAGLS